jgi:uncharacterized RDD family membrane protein YckC
LDQPDFSQYTEEQLRQILTRIDAGRFPERVAAIHARLAELAALGPAATPSDGRDRSDGPPEIAGFWRRIGAFLIDMLLLGLVGFGLGLGLHAQFEAIGAWGRAIGFLIAVAYFGMMESRLFDGRTFGKRALDIKVVSTAVAPLGIGKALLRAAVFHIPYFLNNASLGAGYTNLVLPSIQGLLIFGLGGAISYLYVFNRRTRQSVHDLLAGAVVVRARTVPVPALAPVWKGHMAIVATLLVVSIGALAYLQARFQDSVLQPLMLVQQQVIRMPGVRDAGVFQGTSWATGNQRANFLTVRAVTGIAPAEEQALAGRIAAIALATYPAARQLDTLSVTLVRGYDIGIASHWDTKTFDGPPGAWRR